MLLTFVISTSSTKPIVDDDVVSRFNLSYIENPDYEDYIEDIYHQFENGSRLYFKDMTDEEKLDFLNSELVLDDNDDEDPSEYRDVYDNDDEDPTEYRDVDEARSGINSNNSSSPVQNDSPLTISSKLLNISGNYAIYATLIFSVFSLLNKTCFL